MFINKCLQALKNFKRKRDARKIDTALSFGLYLLHNSLYKKTQ